MSMVLDKDTLTTPYFELYINDVKVVGDARRSITSVEFEESDSDADLIRISVTDYSTHFIDNTGLEKDAKIRLIFGHAKNYRETKGIVSIIEADFTENGAYNLSIVAIDNTNKMTYTKKTRMWKKVKRSDVVTKIAKEYGFKAVVKDTKEVLDQISQDDETDAQFIKSLADSEALQFYLVQETNTIYFDERFKNFKVRDTLYYNSGDSSIINFKPNLIAKNKSGKIDESNKDVSDTTGNSVGDSYPTTTKSDSLSSPEEARDQSISVTTGRLTSLTDAR